MSIVFLNIRLAENSEETKKVLKYFLIYIEIALSAYYNHVKKKVISYLNKFCRIIHENYR